MNFAERKHKHDAEPLPPDKYKKIRKIMADVKCLLPFAIDSITVSRLREILQILNAIEPDDFIRENENEHNTML